MRVTTAHMAHNLVRNLRTSSSRLENLQNKLSTGKEVRYPSDSPSGVVESLRIRTALYEVEQFDENATDGLAWMNSTEQTLDSLQTVLSRARDLAVMGASGTLPQQSFEALADEMDDLYGETVDVLNASHAGKYVFSGQKLEARPFSLDALGNVVYNGDTKTFDREIGPGSLVAINVTGDRFMAAGANVFVSLKALIDDLRAGNYKQVSDVRIGELSVAIDKVLGIRSDVGAKMNRLELVRIRTLDTRNNLTELLGQTEDVDVEKTLIELKMAEMAHDVALSVGARIVPKSLVDFLR